MNNNNKILSWLIMNFPNSKNKRNKTETDNGLGIQWARGEAVTHSGNRNKFYHLNFFVFQLNIKFNIPSFDIHMETMTWRS